MAVRKLSIVGIPDPETVPMDASEREEKSEEGDEEFGQIQNSEREENSKREIKRTNRSKLLVSSSDSVLRLIGIHSFEFQFFSLTTYIHFA